MIKKLLSHIKILSALILAAGILATGFLVWKLEGRQSYTAQAYLQVKKLDTETGLMPDGQEFPAEGFLSETVLNRVIAELSLDMPVEELRKQITMTAYLDSDKQAQRDALLEDGKDLETYPDEYRVTVTADSARQAYEVCDALLISYRAWYQDRYITLQDLENPAEIVLSKDTEPLDALGLLSEECQSLKEYLNYKRNDSPSFRSVTTGYSMRDLYDLLDLEENRIAGLYADLYSGAVSDDRELLLQTLQTGLESAQTELTRTQEETDAVKEIMDTYAEKMKESYRDSDVHGDTSYYMVEEFVEEGNRYTGANAKTTYDRLIEEYTNLLIRQEKQKSEIEKTQMVISFYSDEDGWEEGTGITARTEKSRKEVTAGIRENAEWISNLYQEIRETNVDYRDYLYQDHLAVNGSIRTSAAVNTRLYSLVAVAFGMACCFCTIAGLVIGKKFLQERGVL